MAATAVAAGVNFSEKRVICDLSNFSLKLYFDSLKRCCKKKKKKAKASKQDKKTKTTDFKKSLLIFLL